MMNDEKKIEKVINKGILQAVPLLGSNYYLRCYSIRVH